MAEEPPFDELSYLRNEVRRLRAALNRLTPPLPVLLRRKGFQIYKKEPSDDLLVPKPEFIDDFYAMLHKYSFRLFLRDAIKHQEHITMQNVTRYATLTVTGGYLDYIVQTGLAVRTGEEFRLAWRVKSFGETLEWYVAEVLKREFGAEAVWGVKFKRPKVGGDYDVIAKFDGLIFYAEVKSSPPRQIYDSEISAFLDRTEDLSPGLSVFLMDTELRMKDKIVPMFEKELAGRRRSPEVVRIEKELFRIEDRMFIINARDTIISNLRTVLSQFSRK